MFRPTTPEATAAYNYLVRRPWPGYVYPDNIDQDDLYQVLLAITCPIPCDGHTSNGGASSWHAGCERRAQRALDILMSGADPRWHSEGEV